MRYQGQIHVDLVGDDYIACEVIFNGRCVARAEVHRDVFPAAAAALCRSLEIELERFVRGVGRTG